MQHPPISWARYVQASRKMRFLDVYNGWSEGRLTQAELAARMGTQAPAVDRLERALATGKHSPSVATLRK